jgi:hypothetical protein
MRPPAVRPRLLLVSQAARSFGEFRRPWVRRLYRRFVAAHRRRLAAAAARLARRAEVTVLASRELVDPALLPPGVRVLNHDEQPFRTDTEELARLAARLEAAGWPDPAAAPRLRHHGIWLPEVAAAHRRLVLRLELAEPAGALAAVWDEVKPERLAVLTGASVAERVAVLLARRDGLPVQVAAPGFLAARLYARAQAALDGRDERLRLRRFLDWPRRPVAAPAAGAGPRIVFVICRPRQHLLVDPLVDAVRAAGADCHVLALGVPELAAPLARLEEAGAGWSWLSDHLPREEGRRLVAGAWPAVLGAWRRVAADPGRRHWLLWRGLDLAGLARPFLRVQVELSLRTALAFQEAAVRALDALRPAAVVLTNTRRHAERALALAARRRGIPCLIFSNALVMVRERQDFSALGDRLLVMGAELRQRLVAEQGLPAARVSVLGDPRSRAARRLPRARLRAEVLGRFGLADDRPLVAVVSKYVSLLFSIEEKEAFYRAVFGARRRLGDPHVIVKVHPNEDPVRLAEQVRAWGCPDALLSQDLDIHRLFGAADVAVMVTSMAGVEAMAMGCPVVAVQTAGKDFDGGGMPAYVAAGAVERVDMRPGDPEAGARALAATLGRLLGDPAARRALIERGRRFAAAHVGAADERLGERLLEVVGEVRAELAAAGRSPA